MVAVVAWSNYDEICEGETMERVWAKLEDIAKIVIAAGGENDNDEGRKAGARKRVAASRAAAAAAPSVPSPPDTGDTDPDSEVSDDDPGFSDDGEGGEEV